MAFNNRRSVAFFAFLPILGSGGCTWRTGNSEHYLGPVVFRYSNPPLGQAHVGQVLRYGFSAEGGTSWGVSVGVSERVTVAPVVSRRGNPKTEDSVPHWTFPLLHSYLPTAGEWNISLLYLRVDREPRIFLSRSIYGAEIVMGDEANALTVGMGRRTLFSPPKNAFSTMHFESDHPMLARAKVWPDVSEHGPLPDDLLEEIGK